jgi:transketolase
MNDDNIYELKITANLARQKLIEVTTNVEKGHLGGSLSCIDILTALYFRVLRHNPNEFLDSSRDRFILSKGHASPAFYVILSLAGYFPESELFTLAKINSRLQGHPDCKKLPGVEISSGSLGQGLSVAIGMALGCSYKNKNPQQVYCLLGDGECDEGQVWEAAMFAASYDLKNITAIIDRNKYQIDGKTEDVIKLEPLASKWDSFNWDVVEIDGHNMDEIVKTLESSRNKRVVIIANTIKGKGISFIENNNTFHAKYCNETECREALDELKTKLKNID